MIEREEILGNHMKSVMLEIAKIDDHVMSTEKIPVDELGKLRKKAQDLRETFDYLNHLAHYAATQPKQESKLIKL